MISSFGVPSRSLSLRGTCAAGRNSATVRGGTRSLVLALGVAAAFAVGLGLGLAGYG